MLCPQEVPTSSSQAAPHDPLTCTRLTATTTRPSPSPSPPPPRARCRRARRPLGRPQAVALKIRITMLWPFSPKDRGINVANSPLMVSYRLQECGTKTLQPDAMRAHAKGAKEPSILPNMCMDSHAPRANAPHGISQHRKRSAPRATRRRPIRPRRPPPSGTLTAPKRARRAPPHQQPPSRVPSSSRAACPRGWGSTAR